MFCIRFKVVNRIRRVIILDVACCRSEEEGGDDPPLEESDDHLGLGLGAEGMSVLLVLCNRCAFHIVPWRGLDVVVVCIL